MAGAAAAQTQTPSPPRILQEPAISRDLVAFSYGGDIWTVPRAGGRATRLTTGVGVENRPLFSPDGRTLAFTGDYDGNVDVYTVPVTGGVPTRLTWHPSSDVAVAWTRDGRGVLFRSNRAAASRYTQMFAVPVEGGPAKALPLPMAYNGEPSPDGASLAYNPIAPAFSFGFTNWTAWGNYKGGQVGVIKITTLSGLDTVEVPHEPTAADFSPVWAGGKLYFLSARRGPIGVWSYDPATRAVAEVFHNTGADLRTLSTDGRSLIFDRLGELWTLEPGGQPQRLNVDVAGDMPDVRARILNVADQVETVSVSPTGVRAVVEAHGEILTAPAKRGPMRNVTNTPGVMERDPAWSPDGQSVAYFSDADGLYALHVAAQTGAQASGASAVRKIKLAPEAAYYSAPLWSPDSKKIAFYDNRLNTWVADLTTGQAKMIGTPDSYGGFGRATHDMSWSPDSKWLAYPHSTANHMHMVMLYSTATGASTQLTDTLADAASPAFDRNGKYLYFLASNNAGGAASNIDMTSNLYQPTSSVYALALTRDTVSPVAPESDDEKSAAEAQAAAKDEADATPAGKAGDAKAAARTTRSPPKPPVAAAQPTAIDVAALSPEQIAGRIVALPLPARDYRNLRTGKPGVLYVLRNDEAADPDADGPPTAELGRWTLKDRKWEKLAESVQTYQVTADGEKLLVGLAGSPPPGGPAPGGAPPKPTWVIAPADKPVKPGDPDTSLRLAGLQVRVDPAAEWAQMYKEVWRMERAYFYDPAFHGVDTVAEEKRLQPWVGGVQSRSDLNYLFQEMLTGMSVGHLRGSGGAIPAARRVPGGLLGADYEIKGGRWRIAKIYTGGNWSPDVKAPLAQPGLNVRAGDAILSVNGQPLDAATDIQKLLEGTAGQAVTLRLAPSAGGVDRDVTVVPVASEARLRNLDWIDGNRRKVAELSGGKLAYVYMPDTGGQGFAAFNRYFFAQTDKQGLVLDDRFNAGGQIADYVVEVLGRKVASYQLPRYGAIERSPSGAIYGPKVMLINEMSSSGGDYMPWLFKESRIGPLVGKRTWGGLVGIGPTPVLMDGGNVTAPSVGIFSTRGAWEVENMGVAPDVPVEQDPKAVAAGRDPQLERAVALAMAELAKSPPPQPKRPAFPSYRRP